MEDMAQVSIECEVNCETKSAGSSDFVEEEIYKGLRFRVNKFLTKGTVTNMVKGDVVRFRISGLKSESVPKYNLQ